MRYVKNKKVSICKFFTIFFLFAIPFFIAIQVVIINNKTKINEDFKITVLSLLIILIVGLFVSLFLLIKDRRIINVCNMQKKIGFLLILFAYILEIFGVVNLIYYNNDFKNWLINSSIGSLNYKYVATTIYDDTIINNVVDNEFVDLSDDEIDFSTVDSNLEVYANKYEEEILNHDEDDIYKIIKISGTTIGADYHYEGYMAVIYDPSLVKIAKSSGAGTSDTSYGETLSVISRKNNALIAMNAGGFYDPNWNSNGGIPHGPVFIDGILDSDYASGDSGGGIIGFDNNDRLILKKMTVDEAYSRGIRDAIEWGPFLIVNGVNYYKDVNYYTWACGRAAIGQREDGIVLMLVIDGLQSHSKGASYADMAHIMELYGAVNAANLDGGTSTSMTVNHEYINSPWNGYVPTYRWLPNAWIVVNK